MVNLCIINPNHLCLYEASLNENHLLMTGRLTTCWDSNAFWGEFWGNKKNIKPTFGSPKKAPKTDSQFRNPARIDPIDERPEKINSVTQNGFV